MEEEPNEHELEERLYAMLHHVDETQANVNPDIQNDAARIVENAPRSSVRRYWRTSGDHTAYQKVNTPKDNAPAPATKTATPANNHLATVNKNPTPNNNNAKPKEEKCEGAGATADLSLFQSPAKIIKKNIEILETENVSVLLESSDEDEVIEVELPPKPTITIESSDDDEVCIISKPATTVIDQNKNNAPGNATPTITDREISASPVPSVVSSVSDDFIRSDCIALNISSRRPDNHSFDFSLHGSDLLGQVTPSKKKKKKKSKEAVTSTPVNVVGEKPSNPSVDTCFATPKSKGKEKKQKTKYTVSEKSLPSADVYDSDSNQSAIESFKDGHTQGMYAVTDKSLPSVDIYESDSSQPDNTAKKRKSSLQEQCIERQESSVSLENHDEDTTVNSKGNETSIGNKTSNTIVDLTENDSYITLDTTGICENIVMANVTGFQESEDYSDTSIHNDAPKFGSTKVPQILFDNLDFDNLKGKDKVCKRRRYSLTTLRAEMEKFYNESWGGEDFNHREIQKYMSRDKSLWVIDPKDRMPGLSKRRVTCNLCNRPGHRDDTCRLKQPVCYMCGNTGHYEPRCPSKICVNCGSPNYMYSTMCRNCSNWGHVRCAECGQTGHPSSHCPDVWRRYHNTISGDVPLSENRQLKKSSQQFCSGCTRRGHLVHTCRVALPFSGLPINSPYVALYRPVYRDPAPAAPPRPDNKRPSKSPAAHDTHVNKKKNTTGSDVPEPPEKTKPADARQRKNSQGRAQGEDTRLAREAAGPAPPAAAPPPAAEPAPDFIPIAPSNRDKQGQMIQDNEVSDTSDVVTSARIYVTADVVERLRAAEGGAWLQRAARDHAVTIDTADVTSFLSIRGKLADQEAFQSELRDWTRGFAARESAKSDTEGDVTLESENNQSVYNTNIPKNRNNVLRKLSKALESLKTDLGDPKDIYKELNYLQNRHEQLLKQKIISPKQLTNNRDHINEMLKKLNMVLLGQAGLAEGSEHLSELHSLHEKLTNYRQKNIPANLRKKIGQHYHSIFTAIPRDDYAELLNMYYVTRQGKILKKRYKDKFQLAKKRKKQKTNINPVAVAQTFPNMKKNVESANVVRQEKNTHSRKAAEQATLGKLSFYHRRVLNARPADSGLKKTRLDLARKLHSHISSLYRNDTISSKAMKKAKRIQEQAALFLNNV